jgi:hypothetical protein
MRAVRLIEDDEQFDAFRHMARWMGADDEEAAAYLIEVFCSCYYREHETLVMALALAKKTFLEMGGEIREENSPTRRT